MQNNGYDQDAASCDVLYLTSCCTASLSGPLAARQAVTKLFKSDDPLPTGVRVNFKVSNHGITLTDKTRRLFFRKHYPAKEITFCSLDPDGNMWSVPTESSLENYFLIFAVVVKQT